MFWTRKVRPVFFGLICAAATTANASSYQQIYIFAGGAGNDGEYPYSTLVKVGGALFGTTAYGHAAGAECAEIASDGCGVIYSITPSGNEQIRYSFAGYPDGAAPVASLLNLQGKLYGTTQWGGNIGCGGQYGCGTVFKFDANGTETSLYKFAASSGGAVPAGSLINIGSTLYGIAGTSVPTQGEIYALSPSGDQTVLHTFTGGADGIGPTSAMINVGGTLYGTTYNGGGGPCINGCGTVFSMTPNGDYKVVYRFLNGRDGRNPSAGLLDFNGILYGTTYYGGNKSCPNCGTVFSMTIDGKLTGEYYFGTSEGSGPDASLINVAGTLYGTTFTGGTKLCECGTVFSLKPGGKITTRYSFTGGLDGARPEAALVELGGTLYGTTAYGGNAGCLNGGGCGTVFAIRP